MTPFILLISSLFTDSHDLLLLIDMVQTPRILDFLCSSLGERFRIIFVIIFSNFILHLIEITLLNPLMELLLLLLFFLRSFLLLLLLLLLLLRLITFINHLLSFISSLLFSLLFGAFFTLILIIIKKWVSLILLLVLILGSCGCLGAFCIFELRIQVSSHQRVSAQIIEIIGERVFSWCNLIISFLL